MTRAATTIITLFVLASCHEQTAPAPTPTAAPTRPPEPKPLPAPGCTIESIRAAVRPRMGAITACYRAAAQQDPTLGGRVAIELGINPAKEGGHLARRSVYRSDLPIPVGACIVGALDGLTFAGRFDEPCVIVYPFVFSASRAPR